MIDTISAAYLLAFGILLIGIEVLTFSFVLVFIGLGFAIVALLSFFYLFDNGAIQIALAFILALILAFSLRKTLMSKLSKSSTKPEERAHTKGVGFVEDGLIKFDGTYWKTLDDLSDYQEGDRVEIQDVIDNKVVLKK
ncbi:NfeD family protein [Sulfurospirillum sp. 1612]|uniref:NfeD family protein n=1 Tax=Sulfurospirillum sp. 1612 TaxID=3094835 RepID=UPI002F9209B4